MIRTLAGVSLGWLGISMVADGVPALLVPHQIAASGRGAGELGWMTLVAIGLAALAQPLAGGWSDRIGRVPVVVVGLTTTAAGLTLVLDPSALFAGTVLSLIGVSTVQAGYQGLLPDRLPPRLRGRGAGAKGLFDVGGAFAAFAILAGILAAGQSALAVGILIASLVGAVGLALALVGEAQRPATTVSGDWWQRLRAPGGLTQLILARFLFLLGIYAVGRFLLLFIAERQGLSADAAAGEAGAVLALLTLLTAGAALPAGWLADRIGRRTLMLLGGLSGALGIGLLPLAASSALLLAFGGLVAIGSAAFGAGSWAMLADLSDGADAGRLLGIANFGTAGAAAAAGLFGPLIDNVNTVAPGNGYTVAFLAAAAFAALGALVAWRLIRPTPGLQPAFEVPD